jgi:hypothetical protein
MDSLANSGKPIRFDDLVLFLDLTILVQGWIREPIKASGKCISFEHDCEAKRACGSRSVWIFSNESGVLPQNLASAIATV